MNDNVKLRIKYWTVLFNWGFVIVYVIGLRYLYLLCQFGGVRRRLPVIAACGLVGIIWLISWTVMYLRGKKKGTQKVPVRHKVSILFLCMQIVVILVSTILYSVKIVNSAKAYNGKLSWKIEEKKNSRKIELVHDNIYKDGINGIFTDLKKKLNLPSELYIANMFSLEFDKEGTITDIYSFFYGKDTDGEEQTYLLQTVDKTVLGSKP